MNWMTICKLTDLVDYSGVCALAGQQQLALFKLTQDDGIRIYALGNYDPIGKANVISRGIIGSVADQLMVASPLYKQRYRLEDGQCLDDPQWKLDNYAVRIVDQHVQVALS